MSGYSSLDHGHYLILLHVIHAHAHTVMVQVPLQLGDVWIGVIKVKNGITLKVINRL